jgi:phage terminase large subunit
VAVNPLVELVGRYGGPGGEGGPLLFVRELLGVEVVDGWQEEVLRAFGRRERLISIRSCHGPGKTALAAWLVLYMLIFRYPQNTIATAPSTAQLEDALVVRVLEWLKRLPVALQELLEVKKNRIELRGAAESSWFSARTAKAENPEALQGAHSANVLLIADEASGVPEQIFEAGAGSMTDVGATTLLLGNPVRTSGLFYDTHHKLKDMWFTVHVGYGDSPRVTEAFANDIARRYGPDSNAYRVRVLGEFPRSDLDTIVAFADVEDARGRDIVVPKRIALLWGLDVARFGDDANCLLKRSRIHVEPDISVWGGVDLMQTAGKVKREWDITPPEQRPEEILIDVIGLGAGVVDRLRELKLPARGVNVSESASLKETYRNLRTELWFEAREWLSAKTVKLPSCPGGCARECPHERLAQELVVPRYSVTSSGKLLAEPKDSMKKRGFKSPNVAEAFILTFASEPISLIGSQGWGTSWGKPVTKDLSYV